MRWPKPFAADGAVRERVPVATRAGRAVTPDVRRRLTDMACLCVPLGLLLGLNVTAQGLPTWALVLAWVLLSLMAWYGLWQRALSRRRAFLNAYFRRISWWRRWLRGGLLLAARQLMHAGLLGLVLLVAVVRLEDPLVWRILLLNVIVLVLLHALVGRLLAGHVSRRYSTELVWRVTLVLNFLLAFPALMVLALHASYPDLADTGLREAIWNETLRQDASSPILLALMQLAAAKDATGWWLGQQLLPGLGEPMFQISGWLIILAAEGVFLWSYLQVGAGALEFVDRRLRPQSAARTVTGPGRPAPQEPTAG